NLVAAAPELTDESLTESPFPARDQNPHRYPPRLTHARRCHHAMSTRSSTGQRPGQTGRATSTRGTRDRASSRSRPLPIVAPAPRGTDSGADRLHGAPAALTTGTLHPRARHPRAG